MGLGGQAIDAIGREHAYRPITGDVLFIGRQTTYFTPQDLAVRLRDHCQSVDAGAIEVDRSTFNRNQGGELATDRSIFRALGNDRVKALDVSDYEGAEIIHNLNEPIPDRLRASADFIVDGSTLDNVFDPAMALRNLAGILRPGGRLLMINAWNLREGAYTLCSAPWYFDYFVANGFADCRVYVGVAAGTSSNIYWLSPRFMADEARVRTPNLACWWRRPYVVALAEKSERSTANVIPTQAHYRSEPEWESYLANLAPIEASRRPHLLRSIGHLFPRSRSHRSRGFIWIDGAYVPRPLGTWVPRPASWLARRARALAKSMAGAKRHA
jgi:SAM-dependent methyltransferase